MVLDNAVDDLRILRSTEDVAACQEAWLPRLTDGWTARKLFCSWNGAGAHQFISRREAYQ